MRSRVAKAIGFGLLVGAVALVVRIAAQPATGIQVTGAWIRWLGADTPSAGYMTVANTGSSLSILVSASSPDFGEVSLHHTLESHGISTMRSIDSVLLRPGESVRFAEGGYHLMLMQPRRSLNAGDRVIVTLVFRSGPPIDVPFTVRTSDSP